MQTFPKARDLTSADTAPTAGGGLAPVVLRLDAVAKRFGPTVALRDATLEIRAGEVHALVGENGSGKSTLVKIMSGVHAPDEGSFSLSGDYHASFRTPADALAAGISTVFQEVLAVESQTVLENLWLGTDGIFRNRRSAAVKRRLAAEILAELLQQPPALDTLLEDLTLSDRQACSIARAVLRLPRVLILDEATSALDFETRSRLFLIIERLSADGVGVILITHRMDEIEEIGDRITVLRSGETVATLAKDSWTVPELVRLMTGSEQGIQTPGRGQQPAVLGESVLETKELRLASAAAPIEFSIREGELVGLAGLEGQGQDDFLRALAGFSVQSGEVVRIRGEERNTVSSNEAAAHAGISYVPRERRAESMFDWMSVQENFALPTMSRDRRGALLSQAATAKRFAPYISRLNIKLGKSSDAITTLSGGNQQKVIIARWLAAEPRILLLNDPTRGIDINAKRDLYSLLRQLTQQGLAIVMLSTDVDEHIELMDRVLVFRENECTRQLTHTELTREALVSSFFGEAIGD